MIILLTSAYNLLESLMGNYSLIWSGLVALGPSVYLFITPAKARETYRVQCITSQSYPHY